VAVALFAAMPGLGRLAAVLAPAEPPARGVLLPHRVSGVLSGLMPGLLSGRSRPELIDIIGVAV
jgi:hypothetical protein